MGNSIVVTVAGAGPPVGQYVVASESEHLFTGRSGPARGTFKAQRIWRPGKIEEAVQTLSASAVVEVESVPTAKVYWPRG